MASKYDLPAEAMDALLSQVANGATLTDLERQTGIDRRQIWRTISAHPDYAEAREIGLMERLDDVEAQLASVSCDVPRVREMARMAMWRAEREGRQRWGASVDVRADLTLSVTVNRVLLDPPAPVAIVDNSDE